MDVRCVWVWLFGCLFAINLESDAAEVKEQWLEVPSLPLYDGKCEICINSNPNEGNGFIQVNGLEIITWNQSSLNSIVVGIITPNCNYHNLEVMDLGRISSNETLLYLDRVLSRSSHGGFIVMALIEAKKLFNDSLLLAESMGAQYCPEEPSWMFISKNGFPEESISTCVPAQYGARTLEKTFDLKRHERCVGPMPNSHWFKTNPIHLMAHDSWYDGSNHIEDCMGDLKGWEYIARQAGEVSLHLYAADEAWDILKLVYFTTLSVREEQVTDSPQYLCVHQSDIIWFEKKYGYYGFQSKKDVLAVAEASIFHMSRQCGREQTVFDAHNLVGLEKSADSNRWKVKEANIIRGQVALRPIFDTAFVYTCGCVTDMECRSHGDLLMECQANICQCANTTTFSHAWKKCVYRDLVRQLPNVRVYQSCTSGSFTAELAVNRSEAVESHTNSSAIPNTEGTSALSSSSIIVPPLLPAPTCSSTCYSTNTWYIIDMGRQITLIGLKIRVPKPRFYPWLVYRGANTSSYEMLERVDSNAGRVLVIKEYEDSTIATELLEFVGEFHDEDGGCWVVKEKVVYRSSADNCTRFYWAPYAQEDSAYGYIGWLKNLPMEMSLFDKKGRAAFNYTDEYPSQLKLQDDKDMLIDSFEDVINNGAFIHFDSPIPKSGACLSWNMTNEPPDLAVGRECTRFTFKENNTMIWPIAFNLTGISVTRKELYLSSFIHSNRKLCVQADPNMLKPENEEVNLTLSESGLGDFTIGVAKTLGFNSDRSRPLFTRQDFKTCLTYLGHAYPDEQTILDCSSLETGRFIGIYATSAQPSKIQLCDIEVLGLTAHKYASPCTSDEECMSGMEKYLHCQSGLCSCMLGYKYDGDGDCGDVNECEADDDDSVCANYWPPLTEKPESGSSLCVNTFGSYFCLCPSGYTWNRYDRCVGGVNLVYGTPCSSDTDCYWRILRCGEDSKTCICELGYAYNGYICAESGVDVDLPREDRSGLDWRVVVLIICCTCFSIVIFILITGACYHCRRRSHSHSSFYTNRRIQLKPQHTHRVRRLWLPLPAGGYYVSSNSSCEELMGQQFHY